MHTKSKYNEICQNLTLNPQSLSKTWYNWRWSRLHGWRHESWTLPPLVRAQPSCLIDSSWGTRCELGGSERWVDSQQEHRSIYDDVGIGRCPSSFHPCMIPLQNISNNIAIIYFDSILHGPNESAPDHLSYLCLTFTRKFLGRCH